jgi:hypothetical protein
VGAGGSHRVWGSSNFMVPTFVFADPLLTLVILHDPH